MTQLVERELLTSDARYFAELAQCIRSSKQSGILILGLIPYFSLFATETYTYFAKNQPDYARSIRLQYEQLFRHARNKIKLFDESDVAETLKAVSAYAKSYFIDSHAGPLAWLKKALQPDLGLFSYGGHIICTTHIAFLNVATKRDASGSFEHDSMQELESDSYPLGLELGKYVGRIWSDLAQGHASERPQMRGCRIQDDLVRYDDVKSATYLKSVFNGPISEQINSCLMWFLCAINYVHYVIRHLATDDADTFFKLKYITLYQVAGSLNRLKRHYYPKGVLSEKSKAYFDLVLSDKELTRALASQKFRNVLVHYALTGSGVPSDKLELHTRLFGLIEHFLDERTFADLDLEVDRQLARVSGCLEDWLQCEGG